MPRLSRRRAVWLSMALLIALSTGVAACARIGALEPRAQVESSQSLRVMTFNILRGGEDRGQPLRQTAEVIRRGEADIVILQEAGASTPRLATMLGFEHHRISSSVAFLSRFPIAERTPLGIKVATSTHTFWVFGVHLEAYPYGPYDLRDDPTLSEAQLKATATKTRAHQLAPVLDAIRAVMAQGSPVFLGGDFNEPSHLDWTAAAAEAGRHFGRKVAWPTSTAVYATGLKDAYRAVHPDPVRRPGDTWTPLLSENEVHDRIDLLYYAGADVVPKAAWIVGENTQHADRVVEPFPSDHRAVVALFELKSGPH